MQGRHPHPLLCLPVLLLDGSTGCSVSLSALPSELLKYCQPHTPHVGSQGSLVPSPTQSTCECPLSCACKSWHGTEPDALLVPRRLVVLVDQGAGESLGLWHVLPQGNVGYTGPAAGPAPPDSGHGHQDSPLRGRDTEAKLPHPEGRRRAWASQP